MMKMIEYAMTDMRAIHPAEPRTGMDFASIFVQQLGMAVQRITILCCGFLMPHRLTLNEE